MTGRSSAKASDGDFAVTIGDEAASAPRDDALTAIAGVLGPANADDEQTATDKAMSHEFDMINELTILNVPCITLRLHAGVAGLAVYW